MAKDTPEKSLPHVPYDVVIVICEFLGNRGNRNARLVNREWCEAATRHLFRRVYLSSHPKDLKVFKKITGLIGQRKFGKYVNELVWDDTTVPDDEMSREEFLEKYDREYDRALRLDMRSRDEMDKIHADWHKFVSKHADIRRNRLDQQVLFDALDQNLLPILRRVVLTRLPFGKDIYTQSQGWAGFRSPTLRWWRRKFLFACSEPESFTGSWTPSSMYPEVIWSDNDMPLPDPITHFSSIEYKVVRPLFKVALLDRVQPWYDLGGRLEVQVVAPWRGLSSILGALHDSRKTVAEFAILPGRSFARGMAANPLFQSSCPQLVAFENIARSLEVLDLSLCASEKPVHIPYFGLRAIFEAAAATLRKLRMDAQRIPVMKLLRGIRFRALRSADFRELSISSTKDLFDFLRRHRPAIEVFTLQCTRMSIGQHIWPMLEVLKSQGMCNDVKVCIDGVQDGDGNFLVLHEGGDTVERVQRWKDWFQDNGPFPLVIQRDCRASFFRPRPWRPFEPSEPEDMMGYYQWLLGPELLYDNTLSEDDIV